MKTRILTIILIIGTSLLNGVFGQAIFEPHYSLKTPSTINLISLEMGGDRTILNLSLENQVLGGYFCADNNTYIITDNGERLKLLKAIGIPLCPGVHRFKEIGEILYFTLEFPATDPLPEWFDLEEDCGDLCFSILGIATDQGLNRKMDDCFQELDMGEAEKAASMFEQLLPQLEKSNHGLTGSVYVNLITIYDSLNSPKAEYFRKRLNESSVPHRDKFLNGITGN